MNLLDVNLLVALIWKDAEGHETAHRWLAGKKLAVCPITELGFLRVSMSPAFNASMEDARAALGDFLKNESPQFVPDDERALAGKTAGSRALLTDFYLANLAAKHSMKLATLDAGIKHPAVVFVS